MASSNTIAVEIEPETVFSVSKIPSWISDQARDIQINEDYIYIEWNPINNNSEIKVLEALLKESNSKRGATVITYKTGGLTCRLYERNQNWINNLMPFDFELGSDLDEIDRFGGRSESVDPDFGGVFDEDRRTPQEYMREEHNFELEYYQQGLLTDSKN